MAVLMMGTSASYCGKCNTSADPGQLGHYTQLGYLHNGEPGCGEDWDSVELTTVTGSKEAMEKQILIAKTTWFKHLAHLEWTFFGKE